MPTGDRGMPDEPATKAHIGAIATSPFYERAFAHEKFEDHTPDGGFRRIRRHLTKQEQEKFIDNEKARWRLLIVK